MLAYPASNFDQADEAFPFGRLVAAARPWDSTMGDSATLIVYFNVYLNRANGRPDLPLGTRFDALRAFLPCAAHLVWFAEEAETWYLAHQARVLDILANYVAANGIETVKLVGGSAGGYAAIRFGMLLDRRMADEGRNVAVVAFATNPQTGFSIRLLGEVRAELAAAGWDAGLLGKNPIVLSPILRQAFGPLQTDLRVLGEEAAAANFAVAVISDEGNPIERAFTRDILHWPHVHHAPEWLGIGHGEGAEKLYNEAFWPVFDAVYPVERMARFSGELVSLNG
jgi:hypothetical protein